MLQLTKFKAPCIFGYMFLGTKYKITLRRNEPAKILVHVANHDRTPVSGVTKGPADPAVQGAPFRGGAISRKKFKTKLQPEKKLLKFANGFKICILFEENFCK